MSFEKYFIFLQLELYKVEFWVINYPFPSFAFLDPLNNKLLFINVFIPTYAFPIFIKFICSEIFLFTLYFIENILYISIIKNFTITYKFIYKIIIYFLSYFLIWFVNPINE
jgi:hypothetical protein